MILIAILLCSVFSSAAELSSQGYLNKLSRALRGHPPSFEERKALEKAQQLGQIDDFLQSKIQDYLASTAHVEKMAIRLDELFRFKTPSYHAAMQSPEPQKKFILTSNAANELFRDLARKNLPWSQLLLHQRYSAIDDARFSTMNDVGFFSIVAPQLPPGSNGLVRDQADPFNAVASGPYSVDLTGHPQAAGAISTARFFNRYANSALNKNRRQAAAVFRIFLCDDMSAVIPQPDEDNGPTLRLMLPDGPQTEESIRASLGDSQHGDRADCRKCHYKLDPLGKVFASTGIVLSSIPSKGRLTYKKEDGELVDVPVKGFAQLAAAITKQSEFLSCQTEHFWKWFIGEDVPLSAQRKSKLMDQFVSKGLRTNDMIQILVNSKEFKKRAQLALPEERQAQNIKSLLKNCDSCHSNVTYISLPKFAKWPIGGSREAGDYWRRKIAREMDLQNDGANRSMPPKDSKWQLNYDEFQLLKTWLSGGSNIKGQNAEGELQ